MGDDWQTLLLPSRRSLIQNFGLALLFFLAAVLLRLALDMVVPDGLPFITFFPAVLVTALVSGRWPAILVLVLGAMGGTWWAYPRGEPLLSYFVTCMLFIIVGSGLIAIAQFTTKTLVRLKA